MNWSFPFKWNWYKRWIILLYWHWIRAVKCLLLVFWPYFSLSVSVSILSLPIFLFLDVHSIPITQPHFLHCSLSCSSIQFFFLTKTLLFVMVRNELSKWIEILMDRLLVSCPAQTINAFVYNKVEIRSLKEIHSVIGEGTRARARAMNNINYVRNYWYVRKEKQIRAKQVWPLFHSVSHLTFQQLRILKVHPVFYCMINANVKKYALQISLAAQSAPPHVPRLPLCCWWLLYDWTK